eukprot:EG_transcript_2323
MRTQLVILLCIILFLMMPCHAARSRFRFAVSNAVVISGFGWPYLTNLGRIGLQKYLTAKYPGMVTEHTFADLSFSYTSAYCDPQFEAWAKEGYDLIIGGLQYAMCFQRIATLYPNTTFAAIAGFNGGPPNYAPIWVRFYEVSYLVGYLAGLMTKTKKVCVSATIRFPPPVMDVTGFCRGVHSADPSVEVHILETGVVGVALLDVWNVNQSYAMGCDVVFPVTMTTDGILQASRLGMMSVGFFSDARLAVGELAITSAWVDHVPLFVRTAEAVLNGTFSTEKQKRDWWMGWDWGALTLADPSFLVPPSVNARVEAQKANLSKVFCGRFCTSEGCLCNSSSCCVTDDQIYGLVSYPDFVIEHGVLRLPGRACHPGQLGTWYIKNFTMVCSDCPAGTYAYNLDQVSECRPCPAATYSPAGATACTACPAGTYNTQPGQGQCSACPAGTIAANPGAARCNGCPSGLSNGDGTECASASLVWLAGLGGGVAFAFLLVGLWVWHASRKMRKLRKQFSNDNVAVECAAAIARLDLQAVTWLSDISKPNCIQLSFIRIVKILDEVRKFVPDQLLQSLASGKDSDAEEQEGTPAEELDDSVSLPTSPQTSVKDGQPPWSRAPLMRSAHKSSRSLTQRSSIASTSRAPQGLLAVRKVTYLLVQFHMNQHQPTVNQAESTLKAFMSHLVEQTKAHGGTLGTVAFDRAVVHWGTGRRAVAEGPKHAVETAMALVGFSSPSGADLKLNIAIGCGNTITGVVETATNHFFVVGGGQVPIVERVTVKDCKSLLGVQVLITDAVRASVQYSHLCHPRLVEGDDILWEPIASKNAKADDEWMYQLEQGEEATALTLAALLAPFTALRKGEPAKAESLARELLETHAKDLQPTDRTSLTLLAATSRAGRDVL